MAVLQQNPGLCPGSCVLFCPPSVSFWPPDFVSSHTQGSCMWHKAAFRFFLHEHRILRVGWTWLKLSSCTTSGGALPAKDSVQGADRDPGVPGWCGRFSPSRKHRWPGLMLPLWATEGSRTQQWSCYFSSCLRGTCGQKGCPLGKNVYSTFKGVSRRNKSCIISLLSYFILFFKMGVEGGLHALSVPLAQATRLPGLGWALWWGSLHPKPICLLAVSRPRTVNSSRAVSAASVSQRIG